MLQHQTICFGGVSALDIKDRKEIAAVQALISGEWSDLPPMPTARGWCSAAQVDDCIYVTGGSVVGGDRLATVECFDLSKQQWCKSICAPLQKPRDQHITLTQGGRIWCVGGVSTGHAQALSSLEVYNTRENKWDYKSSMAFGRGYAAGVHHDGYLYIFGGKPALGISKALTSAEKYDPRTNIWRAIAPPLTPRSAHRAIVVGAKILLLGGQVSSKDGKLVTAVNTGEQYDPVTDTWSALPWQLPLPLANFAIHYDAQDGSITIAGGWPIERSSMVYRRDGQTGVWSERAQLKHKHYEAAFV